MNNTEEREESLTLEILQAIDQQEDVTQRHLAANLGVALGLANSYLKRCVRKGLVKIHQVPANRYLYYLTPKGFAEKSRLTAKYLRISFDFYRNAGRSINHNFNQCESAGFRKILFYGISELAEIAAIRSLEHQLEITGIYDPAAHQTNFLNLPVWKKLQGVPDFDACLLTTLEKPEEAYRSLSREIDKERIFVPSILGLNTENKSAT